MAHWQGCSCHSAARARLAEPTPLVPVAVIGSRGAALVRYPARPLPPPKKCGAVLFGLQAVPRNDVTLGARSGRGADPHAARSESEIAAIKAGGRDAVR